MPVNKSKEIQFIYFTIGLFLFAYVLIRAYAVGITYDEAWTITTFVPQTVINIINYTPADANNHIINTLLVKLFFLSGNSSLFVTRLPNILTFILYMVFSFRITYKYLPGYTGVFCFLLLLMNPFVLDFFSLARGYGLSLGFLVASIYYFFLFTEKRNAASSSRTLGFGALSVLSNFPVLNYWLAILIIILLQYLFTANGSTKKRGLLQLFLITFFLGAVLYEPVRKLSTNGGLYYGGNTDFYSDTLVSLTKYTLYSPVENSMAHPVLNVFITLLLVSVCISFASNRSLMSVKSVLLCTTILCIVSVIAQHILLGTLYLVDRTALFFYPLMILCLFFSLNDFSEKWYSKAITLTVTGAFIVNFTTHANVYKTATWYFDAHTLSILDELNEVGKKENRKIKMDFSWPFQSAVGYYTQHARFPYMEVVKQENDREALNPEAEYYIYLARSLERVGYDAADQKILSLSRDTLNYYESEHVFVCKIIKQ